MNSKQEVKLNMYRATEKCCTDNAAITATVPAFQTALTAFNPIISAIITNAQQEDLATKGITIDKAEAKKNLCHLATGIAAQVFAYASVVGDNKLKQEVNFSFSDLFKCKDDLLAPRCQNIKDAGTANLVNLEDYGINTSVLTSFQAAIDDYQAKVPTPRNSTAQKKVLRENLKKLFADGDKLLKERLDKTAMGFKAANPGFLSTYKANRIIVDPGKKVTALKGQVLNTVTKEPIPLAGIVIEETGVKTVTDKTGAYEIKPVAPGTCTLNVSATGYVNKTVPAVVIKQGQANHVALTLDQH